MQVLKFMAEQVRNGALPNQQSDACLTEAKQQLGLIPSNKADIQQTPTRQGIPQPSLSSTPGFSPPETPLIPQGKLTGTTAASIESGQGSHASGHHIGHQEQQQQEQRTQSLAAGIAFRDWQGPLFVLSHKGEELICEMNTNRWPSHLPR